MHSLKQTWQAVLGNLELTLSKANFTTWFKNTAIIDQTEEKIIIGVPNAFTKEWLVNKYHPDILRAIKSVNPQIKSIEYQISSHYTPPKQVKTLAQVADNSILSEKTASTESIGLAVSGLNPKYNFQTFIVGSNNELASAAAQAVAKSPGKSYNPLFIYGGVGLGKTHLMQAVANKTLSHTPQNRILYVTSEKFTNDYVKAISTKRMDDFKTHYRTVDMLLIDDIQFIAGKESTQEEFFHTFNELRDKGKQIIITSDRLPKEIPSIEQRLVSRFEWGMIADIQAPDLETRMAILSFKANERNYSIDPAVLEYIAQTVQTNIRELEGALNRLMVFCQINNTQPTLEKIKDALSNIIFSPKKRAISSKKIMEVVADYYNILLDDLVRQSRKKEYVTPRQIAMYIIRKELETSLPMIGEIFGGRDHTTVIHAIDKIQKLLREKETLKQEISLITHKLYMD
ncbi:MAG: chromosomal replication initiator protein DnaA [bacterium]|nr:chromosomal replication initiator protein DnaA [bacterium]